MRGDVAVVISSGGYGNIIEGPPGTVYKTSQGPRWNLGDHALVREAAALQVLQGIPGIIELLGFGMDEERPFLVLPRIEDKTLEEVEIPYPYSLAVFLLIAKSICEGHARGILHRDIKPGNIFFCSSGPLVFDYGLCYIQGQPELPVKEEYFLGTPHCLPPEVIVNECLVPKPEQDYYQLGTLLHWLVEFEPPIPGGSSGAVMCNVMKGVRSPIRSEMQEARDLLMDSRDLDAGIGLVSEFLFHEMGVSDLLVGLA